MRYVFILLGLLMAAFAAVQYNDPDAMLWIVIYLIPAAWAFAAAFRPAKLRSLAGERLLWATVAIGVGATVFYWPTVPGFWLREAWWAQDVARESLGAMIGNEETVREGLGVMIGLGVLLVVLIDVVLRRRPS
ncbi:MAG TPA: transmembrane 220 family protein [Burkholderiales bacterium]